MLGLGKDSLETFRVNLDDRSLTLAVSQLAASAVTRLKKVDALGINPYGAPRLDEGGKLTPDAEDELARFAAAEGDARHHMSVPPEVLQGEGFGTGWEQFSIHSSMPWFGMWVAVNQWKDVSDLLSVKEQHSYTALERPYKFLQASDKKTVDQDVRGVTAATRKQFPVLLDFNEGRLYVEHTGKKSIFLLTELLKQLGVEVTPVAWTYGRSNWPSAILSTLHEKTQFASDFHKRADEATRFRPKEIEKLEDKELESIVANYFAMTLLSGDLWVGISNPAQIQLHATSQPIAVRAPTTATTLLGMTNDAHVLSGSITVQERITYFSKKGEERTFRKDLLSLDVNDQMNLTDVGAAMLRGFDLPAFKKEIQREIKQTKHVPSIDEFWSQWLHQMNHAVRTIEECFREALELDGDQKAGIQPLHVPETEDLLEFETV